MRIPFLAFLLLFLSPAIRAAVLAIDYGAEFTKLSLVKPGVPFDVVLDRDSKRKIHSVVGWKRDDRVFGAEGKMAAARFPNTHFPYGKPLLGRTEAPSLPVYPSPPQHVNGTLLFPHPSPPSHLDPHPHNHDEVWTPSALVAHQLSYFRGLAEELASPGAKPEPISQVIVTVPPWWNVYQRRAYRDALELQGLTCLAMIGEGTGVALNYAMTRSFPTYNPETGEGQKEYHIIYDSGAMQTTASVMAFYQTSVYPTPKSKTPINTTHIELVGTGWQEIGGVALDLTVQEILAADFEARSGKKGVREDKRAMAKLQREANRVKHILSANQESNVAIESLIDDVDYRSRLSRTDLESAMSDAVSLFSSPIPSALSAAGIRLDDVTSLILFGGNTRVPFVQAAIRDALGGRDIIAQNVNADEGAVLGAAYYGAALSRQFKMKSIEVSETSVWDFTLGTDEVIFPKGTRMGTKKALVLPAEDQTIEFYQAGQPALSVQIIDVATSMSNFTAPSPAINVTVRLDPRGHLSIANAVLVSNTTDSASSGVAGALKGLFGKKDKEDAKEVAGADAEADSEETPSEASSKVQKVAVRFRERQLGVKHMTGEEKRTTLARLTSIAAYEAAKTAREEARNQLEGYLYRLSGLLDSETENRALLEFSTKAEQDALSKLLKDTFEWLSDHAEKADEKTLRAKRDALETLETPIITRFTESRTRPKAVEAFQQAMFAARSFLVEATQNNTLAKEAQANATPEKPVAPPKYTDTELEDVKTRMKELEVWMDGLMTEQVKLDGDNTKDPVIFTQDLDEKGKALQMMVLRLVNKKSPRIPKAKTASKATSSTTSPAAEPTEPTQETEQEPLFPTPDEEPVETTRRARMARPTDEL